MLGTEKGSKFIEEKDNDQPSSPRLSEKRALELNPSRLSHNGQSTYTVKQLTRTTRSKPNHPATEITYVEIDLNATRPIANQFDNAIGLE